MGGVVTLLQLQRRRPDRVSVFVDDEFRLALALDVAAGLTLGQALTDAEIARLAAEDAYRTALERALARLARRPRSRAEIERDLAGRDVPPQVAARVLDRLVELELVDDAAFAAWWVESRGANRPRGRIALRSELAARGVERADIDDALAAVDDEDAACALAVARAARYAGLARDAFDHRLGGYLRRRGFAYDAVRRALDAAWAANSPGEDA